MIELHAEELGDQLQVELHDSRGLLAAGTLSISSLWEVGPRTLHAAHCLSAVQPAQSLEHLCKSSF